tara:strand:- start:387 stop:683 length:297 start_codon:yes stop_codon:yes gene_type:complete
MNYEAIPSDDFLDQLKHLDKKSRKIIKDKIELIEENPFRYKKIFSKSRLNVFRVRLKIQSKETRLIYVVIEPNVILVCLLERKKDYKDLDKYLKKLKR